MARSNFSLRFWGVRGSYAVSHRGALKYGGNTSCVEVVAGKHQMIFDAGTGIIGLGKQLLKNNRGPLRLNLFLSHTHHDHLSGFYFFDPLFDRRNRINIFGPGSGKRSLAETLRMAMEPALFPIGLDALDARKSIWSLVGGESIELRDNQQTPRIIKIVSLSDNNKPHPVILTHNSPAHPNGVILYRVFFQHRSVVYATDLEETPGGYPDVIEFARDADILIHDAQYLESEYASAANPRKGWGHSTVESATEVAKKAGIKRLVLFHHEPTHDDRCIDQILKLARRRFPATTVAAEGMIISL
jgi:phosphoribosyl 1,2-cyclic phosphodiesterase